jgi:hypothetical protein
MRWWDLSIVMIHWFSLGIGPGTYIHNIAYTTSCMFKFSLRWQIIGLWGRWGGGHSFFFWKKKVSNVHHMKKLFFLKSFWFLHGKGGGGWDCWKKFVSEKQKHSPPPSPSIIRPLYLIILACLGLIWWSISSNMSVYRSRAYVHTGTAAALQLVPWSRSSWTSVTKDLVNFVRSQFLFH